MTRHLRAELEASRVPLEESPGGTFRDDQVGGPELSDGEQATDQPVDAGVRRVGHDAERMAGPPKRVEVELEHRHAAAVDTLAQLGRSAWVELDGEHATARLRERDGQRTVACAEVDHEISGMDRRGGDQAVGPLRLERVPSPVPRLPGSRPGRAHGGP